MLPVPSVMSLVTPLSSPRADSIPETPAFENRATSAAKRYWDAVLKTLTILWIVPIALLIFDVGLITLAWPWALTEKNGSNAAFAMKSRPQGLTGSG
jgi:hypothetical protein